jgi:hypothetical protein
MPFIPIPPIDFSALDIPKVTPTIEIRERLERRDNPDFQDATPDGRTNLLSRIRVGARAELNPRVRAEIRYQYAHDLAWTSARNFSREASDIDLAYVEIRDGETLTTVGRQKIAVGRQRLIGPLEWVNVPRSFDGVRVRHREYDAWAAQIGNGPGESRNQFLAGITRKDLVLGETSLFFKHDKVAAGTQDLATLAHTYNTTFGTTAVVVEGAAQAGRNFGRRHEAWALNARATQPLAAGVRGFIEASAASGGPSSGVSRTFDNLYPTNHPFYGLMDLQGWKNMNELALGIEYAPRPNLSMRVEYHGFGLRDARDAWYGAGGAPNRWSGGAFADPTGQSGRDVGRELDLEVTWHARPNTTVMAGLGVFTPGSFVRNVRGSADRQVWGFVQAQVRF